MSCTVASCVFLCCTLSVPSQALVDGFCDIKAVGEVAKRVGTAAQPDNLKVKVSSRWSAVMAQ